MSGQRSFVGVVAWVFIVLTGVMTLLSIVQNVMVHVALGDPQWRQALEAWPGLPFNPPWTGFVVEHIRVLSAAFLGLCLAALAISIGLLQRRRWARGAFVVLMGVGVLWLVVGVTVQVIEVRRVLAWFDDFGGDVGAIMRLAFIFATSMSLLFSATCAGTFAWLGWRLTRPELDHEFGGA